MLETSSRLLSLLALLQTRPAWTGAELADRLEVTTRTVRNDIDRLRELGYPVDAARGPAGHYKLGVGAKLPPLLLDDEEAGAVAVGLRTGAGRAGMEERSVRALTKLAQALPHRLRRQVNAVHQATSKGPDDTGTNVEAPEIDAALLATIAACIRDEHYLRFDYEIPEGALSRDAGSARTSDLPVLVQPYRLVSWNRFWYVVARDENDAWRTYRADWMSLRMATGMRYRPRPMPDGEYTDFVLRDVASTGWAVHARVTVFAP